MPDAIGTCPGPESDTVKELHSGAACATPATATLAGRAG
jgi:hypothetical protein